MIEVYNLDGMPVFKYRSDNEETFKMTDLESRGLPCGIYFVKIKRPHGIETAKLLIC